MRSPGMISRACGVRKARRRDDNALNIRTISKDSAIEVWLYRGERPVHRRASLNVALLADAERHGELLLENAMNDALRHIERGESARRSKGL